MCDDNDLEGVRLWFYGGTPPLDDAGADEPASPAAAWVWPMSHQGHAAPHTAPDTTRDPAREWAAA